MKFKPPQIKCKYQMFLLLLVKFNLSFGTKVKKNVADKMPSEIRTQQTTTTTVVNKPNIAEDLTDKRTDQIITCEELYTTANCI